MASQTNHTEQILYDFSSFISPNINNINSENELLEKIETFKKIQFNNKIVKKKFNWADTDSESSKSPKCKFEHSFSWEMSKVAEAANEIVKLPEMPPRQYSIVSTSLVPDSSPNCCMRSN